jgi:hypothetical protein
MYLLLAPAALIEQTMLHVALTVGDAVVHIAARRRAKRGDSISLPFPMGRGDDETSRDRGTFYPCAKPERL